MMMMMMRHNCIRSHDSHCILLLDNFRNQLILVLLERARVLRHRAVVNNPHLAPLVVAHLRDEPRVVRHEHHAPLELLERLRELGRPVCPTATGAADEAAQRAFAARVSDDFRRRFNLTEGLLEALRDVERGRTGTGSAGG